MVSLTELLKPCVRSCVFAYRELRHWQHIHITCIFVTSRVFLCHCMSVTGQKYGLTKVQDLQTAPLLILKFECSWHPGGRRVVGYARRSSPLGVTSVFAGTSLFPNWGPYLRQNAPNRNDTAPERHQTIFSIHWSQTIGEQIEHVSAF